MATRTRRPQGTARDTIQTNLRLTPEAKARLFAMADATGVTVAQVITEVIMRVETDDYGAPAWWDRPTGSPAEPIREVEDAIEEAMLQAS